MSGCTALSQVLWPDRQTGDCLSQLTGWADTWASVPCQVQPLLPVTFLDLDLGGH